MEETKTTQQIIDEKMQVLPPSIQHAINESGWEEKIRNIAKKHNLLIDQAGIVENETFLTMLGLTRPDEYTKNIKEQAGLNSETALSITTDVNNEIFHTIKETLVALSEYEEALDEYESAEEELQKQSPNNGTLEEKIESNEPLISRKSVIDEIKNDINIIEDEDDKKATLENNVPNNIPTGDTNSIKTSMEMLYEKPVDDNVHESTEPIQNLESEPENADLPPLNAVRTLNSDKEDKDDIISRKLSKSSTAKIDPYREPLL